MKITKPAILALAAAAFVAGIGGCKGDCHAPMPPEEGYPYDIYAAGYVGVGGIQIATRWTNGVAQPALATPVSIATSVGAHGADLWAAGRIHDGTNNIATLWKNGVAQTPALATTNSQAYSVIAVKR